MIQNERRTVFPFSAIVGQEKAKLALLCCAVDPTIGGVLLSGEKGTAKSTLVRALSHVLPEEEFVEGCPFNCNPNDPLEMCDTCYSQFVRGVDFKIARRRMKVVDLPLNITVDRLVGTLDIKRALSEGIRALQPGILAEANRNILYIDEVNLLDDYVADVLLDAAAMGWNIVEREGISVKHPARFILVGSMNPEEGELRPQLLDRFGLYVPIEALNSTDKRIEIVRRVERFRNDPISFYKEYESEEEKIRSSVINARKILREVEIDQELLKILVETVLNLGIGTHRAEIVTARTAKAIAALEGRKTVNIEDLKKAMELALPHRLRKKPFEKPPKKPPLPQLTQPSSPHVEKNTSHQNRESREQFPPVNRQTTNQQMQEMHEHKKGDKEKVFHASKVDFKPDREIFTFSSKEIGSWHASRSCVSTVVGYPKGYPVSYSLPTVSDHLRDIDITATINAAASKLKPLPLLIDEDDFRVRIRKHRMPKLSVIVLDSSGSMGVMRRISVAKGLAQKLVEDSYIERDYVALVTFRGEKAEVTVPPTRNYIQIMDALEKLPTGGRTPLPSALQLLLTITKKFKTKNKKGMVEALLITDGKANVPLRGPLSDEIKKLSFILKKSDVKIEIFDTRPSNIVDPAPSYIDNIAHFAEAKVYRVD